MDKNRALIEIERILWSKDSEGTPVEVLRLDITKVLQDLHNHSYNWGTRNGMFKAINLLTEIGRKSRKLAV